MSRPLHKGGKSCIYSLLRNTRARIISEQAFAQTDIEREQLSIKVTEFCFTLWAIVATVLPLP